MECQTAGKAIIRFVLSLTSARHRKLTLLVFLAFLRAALQPRDVLPVLLSVGCQCDRIQNYLADVPLGLSVRKFGD